MQKNSCITWWKKTIERGMDWFKVFMWIASICVLTAMVGEYFLPQIVVVALAFVGTAIMVAIVAYLMDGE